MKGRLAMTKKNLIELANVVRAFNPGTSPPYVRPTNITHAFSIGHDAGRRALWADMQAGLADFCAAQNRSFARNQWLAYIAGECGPGGEKVEPKITDFGQIGGPN